MNSKKILHVLRHGKSEWNNPALRDIDRPLKMRGVNAVRRNVSHILPEEKPEIIVSSHAIRATHTAIIAAGSMEISYRSVAIDEILYLADVELLDQYMKNTKNNFFSLMMVGHNPGFTEWINRYLEVPLENLPTAGLATFVFASELWQNVGKENVLEARLHLPSK